MMFTRCRTILTLCLFPVVATGLVLAAEPAIVVIPPAEIRTTTPPKSPRTSARLLEQLSLPVPGVSWRNIPLRRILRQVAERYDVATFRDRRLDPTTLIEVEAANAPLRDVLEAVAADAGGELRIVENVAYWGPSDAAAIIRTLVELRKQDLARHSRGRATRLLRTQTVRWGDLSEPVVVAEQIAARFDLTIENPKLLPHDLLEGAVLPEMSAAEMLTLVLLQFDLTFAWSDDLASIRLEPLPEDRRQIALERTYVASQHLDVTLATWKNERSAADTETNGRQMVVRGPLELHELISEVRPVRPQPRSRTAPTIGDAVPLSRRQFTLTVSRVPASAVLKKLEDSGIVFEYDAEALSNAGIDLDAPVAINVEQAGADEFFETLLGPLGLAVRIEGLTVHLRPADR